MLKKLIQHYKAFKSYQKLIKENYIFLGLKKSAFFEDKKYYNISFNTQLNDNCVFIDEFHIKSIRKPKNFCGANIKTECILIGDNK